MKKLKKKKLYGGKLNDERVPKINKVIIIENLLFVIFSNLKIKLFEN